MRNYYVYIMTNRSETLYVGVTNNIVRRVAEHKSGRFEGFTSKYKIDVLIYLEQTTSIEEAILREKQLKRWNRQKKLNLIATLNPEWIDLSTTLEMTV